MYGFLCMEGLWYDQIFMQHALELAFCSAAKSAAASKVAFSCASHLECSRWHSARRTIQLLAFPDLSVARCLHHDATDLVWAKENIAIYAAFCM